MNIVQKAKIIFLQHYNKPSSRRIMIIVGVVALLLIAGFGIKKIFFDIKKLLTEEAEMAQVKVEKAKLQDFTDKYTVMGTIKGSVENELRFETDGIIARYNFKEGARIKKGQIICSLDPKDAYTKTDYARSKYTSEQSNYFSASQRLKIYEDLFKMEALAESKLQEARYETQSAEAKMKAALAELDLAQSSLAKTNLVAPSRLCHITRCYCKIYQWKRHCI
ncbi:efflux RND transporter periplasmic adaptor subunit [Elusimicrobiota bacterium]